MKPAVHARDPLSFTFSAPTRLVVGPGAIGRLGALARELGATRALVTSDPGIVEFGHTAAGPVVAALRRILLVSKRCRA